MKNETICLNFQGSKGNNVLTEDGTSFSLMAMHGHDVHVVCFEKNVSDCYVMSERQISMMCTKNVSNSIVSSDYKGPQVVCFQKNQRGNVRNSCMHNTNYPCYAIDHVVTTGGNCTAQGPCVYENICPTEKASGVHAVCYENK